MSGSSQESLAEMLVESQRLALAGTTAAMLAHEFNNLMTPILARSMDALQRDDVAAMRKALDRTVTQAQKAIALSRHLLRLTEPDGPEPETCDVAQAVEEAVAEAVRPFEKDGIELRCEVPAGLQVKARALLLEQVLLNLLLNARAAMKEMPGPLVITAERHGEDAVIAVRDAGKGIPPEEIERTYNPFLAAPADQDVQQWRRVGLGLHVCRLIAQQHGASISVRANEGRGCTFTIRWPLS